MTSLAIFFPEEAARIPKANDGREVSCDSGHRRRRRGMAYTYNDDISDISIVHEHLSGQICSG